MVEPISLFFVLDIDECKHELHNCSSDQSCVNQIGSFICLPDPTGCDGSESSQLKSKAVDLKNHVIRDFTSNSRNILHFRLNV